MFNSFSFHGIKDLKLQLSKISNIPVTWETLTFWESEVGPEKGLKVVFEFNRMPTNPTYVKRWYCEGKYTDSNGFSDALMIDKELHDVVPFESLIKEIVKVVEIIYSEWVRLSAP